MNIELHRIKVRDLVDGYVDDAESGVRGYGGRLDIRPAYQREFVYREKERDAVISTVMRGFPLPRRESAGTDPRMTSCYVAEMMGVSLFSRIDGSLPLLS